MQITLDTKSITNPAEKAASKVKDSLKDLASNAIDAKNKLIDACAPVADAVKTYGLGIGAKAEVNFCPTCGISIEEFGKINYCPQCGRKI